MTGCSVLSQAMTEAGRGQGATVVSVVVPVRDGARWLGACLDGLAAQEPGVPWEVVVADDGSTDAGPDLAAEHRLGDRCPVTVLRHPRPTGSNGARNRGVDASRGRLVVLLDADDVPAQGWLAAHVAALQDAVPTIAGGPLELRRLNPPGARGRAPNLGAPPTTAGGVPWAVGTNMAFQRVVWDGLGGFDDSWSAGGDEVELAIRAHRAGIPFTWVDGAVVHYRLRRTLPERWTQIRARGRGNRRLAERYPVEMTGKPSVPPLRWSDGARRALGRLRRGEPVEAVDVLAELLGARAGAGGGAGGHSRG